MGTLSEELFDIIKSGFDNPDDFKVRVSTQFTCLLLLKPFKLSNENLKSKGYDRGVPFSNSLSVCDHYRIESLRDGSKQAQNSLRYGKNFEKFDSF